MINSDIKTISIVIPVHNEALNIKHLFNRISSSVLEIKNYQFEILFVDDGSSDNTLECIRSISSEKIPVGYVKLSRNFGHQFALLAGLKNARGEAVITMDGDLQHPPEMIPEMVKLYVKGAEVVQMRRKNINSNFKGIISFLFYFFFKKISKVPLVPNAADFRLMSKKIVSLVNQSGKGILLRAFVPSVASKQFFLDYYQDERYSGSPSYSLLDSFELGLQTIFIYSTFPARASFFTGTLFLGISLTGFIYTYLTYHNFNFTLLLALLFCFTGGMILCSLGMICWFLYFIFEHSRTDSTYVISEIVEPKTDLQSEKNNC